MKAKSVASLAVLSILAGTLPATEARAAGGGTCIPPCQEGQTCVVDTCVWGCGSVTGHGCCYGQISAYCSSILGTLSVNDCPEPNHACGWDAAMDRYRCGDDFPATDPSGTNPRECDFTCVPRCIGKECGPDGCGGSCGTCGPGQVCARPESSNDRECCTPACEGKDCGDDGCGGSCGTCRADQECVYDNCLWCNSVPPMGCCHGNSIVSCHPDGTIVRFDCWESCGWDAPKDAYTCGTDGGADPTGTYPKECVFACKPDCVDAECGSDGCGGSCGSCGSGDVCVEGKCCAPSCPGGDWSCGPDGCGGSCGECPAGFWCTDLAKCAYGYGCAQMRSAGCQGCGCEDCVCGKDAYCCTDKWDWKCTYICQHDCGGCVPCSDEECPAPPGLPEKADTAETAGVVEGALIADEAGRDAPDDATSPPEPGGEAVPDHPVGPTEEDAHDATAADGPSTDGPAPDGPAASDIPGDPGPDGSARAAGGSGGCSLAGAARRHSPAPWALASLVLVAAAGALARPGRRRQ